MRYPFDRLHSTDPDRPMSHIMYKQLIINMTARETQVALLEDGTIAELFIDWEKDSDIAGNVYKGRVQRVLPGMQAAFVDIGLKQAAFVHVNDVLGDTLSDRTSLFSDNGNVVPEETENTVPGAVNITIEELLADGQEILVQVAKSPIGTKGARVTSYISLPGRFLVMMPNANHIGVSRRIEDEFERQRLRDLVESLRSDSFGYILRTAAEGTSEEKIASEMSFFKGLWENIQRKYQTAPSPSLLHQELNVVHRAVRDLMTHEAEKIVIDSKDGYDSVLAFLDGFMPSLMDSVELYEGREPIFGAFNLEGDISRALKRKVWLKSGGYIVIEHTEALVAIDVNTGRYVGKHNLEETILKTNLEAVKEIAYQIRLRDIGGIIIIDFIDMEKKSNQEKVFNALKDAFRRDRSKTHVLPMSEMGITQMTRKRVRKPLSRLLCEPCFYCDGEGYLMSKKTICHTIYREILRNAQDMMGVRLTLQVNPEIAELLHREESDVILSLEKTIGKQIVVYPNSKFHLEEFDIFEVLTG
ncbi:Ribonuclease G [Olavius algarvensis associated proteobacterium Delta 3]|nr:Ribonuclease G [Olavius algarvensis associated proteobacterium Delta 3]